MTAPSPDRPADPRDLAPLVAYLASAHGMTPDEHVLNSTVRRLARQNGLSPLDALQLLAGELGLVTTVVRRPLAEVVADADPSYPWLAFRADADGRHHGLAVLERRRGGALVVVPGATERPARWSMQSLQAWLGVADSQTAIDWVLSEPAAPLSRLRTPDGAPRLSSAARLRALLRGERQTLVVAVVYSMVIGLLSLAVPVAVQSVVNTIAFGSVLQPLVVLSLLVFVALGFNTLLNGLRAGIVEIIQRSIFARVATDVTHRLLRVRAEAFDRYHGPELVNRFFDVVTVQKSASLLLIDGLSILMQTVIGMLLLAVYHPWLLAFDVLMVLAMSTIVFVLGRGAVATSIKESKAKYALEGWLEQMAAYLVTFKSAGGAAYAMRRSHELLEHYLDYRGRHFTILLRQILASFALQAVASAALLGIGGWLVISRELTLGQLVASELVVSAMVSAFTKFGKQLEVYYDLNAALDKLGDLVDLPLERGGGEAVLPPRGLLTIAVRDLSVHYDGVSTPALRIARWDVAPGERVGLTGPIGSGKSTLADVLFGLRTASSGVVLLDETDMRHVALTELRQHVALVRSVELFAGSIVDNVRLGREHVSLADVSDALRSVGLLDELLMLPDGLDTVLLPHGRPLSYRQACRLMLARAIVGRPRLLVIDGALDQIDLTQEREQLAAMLFAPDAPWTLVCITERPDVLAHCTRVTTLKDGTTVQTSPEEFRA